MSTKLKNKIKIKKATIAVIGLGYVGLPLAVSFAKSGFKVYGLDKDKDRVQRLQKGQSYILDITSKEISNVMKKRKFYAGTQFDILKAVDVILICVPTPLKRKYTPDISYILSAVQTVSKYIRKDVLIVLESTTYPGTTEEMIKPLLEKSGLRAEKDFYLSFSPERIDPGNKKYDVTRIPKVVGGLGEKSGNLTKLLYQKIIKNIHVVSSTKAAEMTKLLENTFRIINIGWVNEVTMMCHKMNIDVWEVIEAAKTKPFGFMPFYPGLGVGGHCIPDDPLYLYWKAKHHGFSSKFIKLSADINSDMPRYCVEQMRAILRKKKKTLKNAKILVVGVTYKKDVKDLRKSPALTLIELLQASGCEVRYFDPIIPYLKVGNIDLVSVGFSRREISSFDCTVIATDHTKINYQKLLDYSKIVFDIKNVYQNKKTPKVVKL